MSTLYVNNIEPVSGSSLTLISASLVSVDNLSVTSLTSSFQGDLAGTASFAITASHALNSTSAAGTEGQMQFNSGSEFGADSNLFWDNTNKRLGVGTSSPTKELTIDANSTDGGLIIRSHTDQLLFSITKDGNSVATSELFQYVNGAINFALRSIGNPSYFNNGTFTFGATTNLGAKVNIKGSGTTSETTSLLVQNSSGTDLLKITDDGVININQGVLSNINVLSATSSMRLDSAGSLGVIRFQGNQIGMGNNTTGDASALLTLTSTTKGFLPPRMTTTQKNAISSPAAGLQVYDSTVNKMAVYNSSSWENTITEVSGSPNQVNNVWSGTQAQYDALTPSSTTLYFII